MLHSPHEKKISGARIYESGVDSPSWSHAAHVMSELEAAWSGVQVGRRWLKQGTHESSLELAVAKRRRDAETQID